MMRIQQGKRLKDESCYLRRFSHDQYSQYGEDGIRHEIFERIGIQSRWCCEIGAGDGRQNSNTLALTSKPITPWNAVLIEGHEGEFKRLKQLHEGRRNIVAMNEIADLNGNGLDSLLAKTPIPKQFDFLCIDVDGPDWLFWFQMKEYRARVVMIEFNPTFANDVYYVQSDSAMQGSSLLAMVELSKTKGYELAVTTGINAFFVDAKDFPKLGIEDNDIDAIHDSSGWVPVIFQDYMGKWVTAHAPQIWTTGAR